MILITRAYPRSDDYETDSYFDDDEKFHLGNLRKNHTVKVRAAREFIEEFGGYYSSGAENLPRNDFLESFGHYLPEYVKQILDSPTQPGNLHFKQNVHINFS